MILERGNMWDVFGKTDLFLITTNPVRRKDGALVMGRGIALEAAKKWPELPLVFGHKVAKDENIQAYDDALHPMFCCMVGRFKLRQATDDPFTFEDTSQMMGYFMVKRHWREPADLVVIEHSVRELSKIAHRLGRIDLNFPGIGNGKLKREDVLPIIEKLPDNVHVWEYGHN